MTALEARKQIQAALGATPLDGIIGPATLDCLHRLINTPDGSPWPTFADSGAPIVHSVLASSFADPEDVAAYRAAKARGLSDEEAFRVGDNAIGCWSDFTGDPDGAPMCALPPENWRPFGQYARGKKVAVTCNGVRVVGELRDTMPALDHITNGAGIDLNPAFLKQLGLRSPLLRRVTWEWV